MRPVLVLLTILALSAPARAEDFTGFYAGANAGYAFGRDREVDVAPQNSAGRAATAPGSQLPPSAAEAARAMRAGRGAERGDRPLR
ncbi:hypothetical protein U8607_09815 [Methylobacterium durans]|uniref:hypothetical protein n=1 Tax=Methylobacterium durans TaxID=2202825 RepID=UPI002AFE6936|nr:hypothetical protein [Methylobacterium durans]MEA1832381.1 hypothetical protein [Methylobacterium durans]